MLDIKTEINRAVREVADEEPWEGYYMVRGYEIENLLRFMGTDSLGKVLELGCGNGFVSHLLSPFSKEVFATDLSSKNTKTHTIGLNSARRLISKMGNNNTSIFACSAEYIPFKDNTFDTVFSSYALHYLKDRSVALSELKRVVKKDGVIILVLPNFMERIYAFFQFYIYFVMKTTRFIVDKMSKKTRPSDNTNKASFSLSKVREDYKYFPFPGPHGAYKNSAIEMIRHLPFKWNQEFESVGLKVKRSLTTVFVPYPLLLTLSTRITSITSALFKPFTRICGDKPLVKYLGYNYCVILQK